MLLQLQRRKRQLLVTRQSLTEWCRLCGFEPAAHHRLIIDALERITRGDVHKLLICMPPGSAKSSYASVLFPPWWLAQDPTLSILAASHSEELAERWGRRVRNLIELNATALGIDVSPGNRAAGRWQLDGGQWAGEYLAAGAGSAIAGFRGDLGLKPRLKPGAKQILIMTRWAVDDLAGRLLESEPGEWQQLILPMIAGPDDPLGRREGDRLWPEWFTEAMIVEAMKDPALWLALYQQTPVIESGTYWKREWFNPVPRSRVPPREVMRYYGGSDYAVEAAAHNDFTVHMVIGLDPSDRPWIVDLWRARASSDVWVEAWCDLVKLWKPLTWAEERGQIISGVGPFLERASHERKAFTERLPFVSRLDKGSRAQSMRGFAAVKGLWYAEDAPWRRDLEAELLAFPVGRHDDQHDALGLVGQLLDLAVHGQEKKHEPAKPKPGYRQMGLRTEPSLKTL
jgi:predicted phage terminase large subunit-like protein